MSLDLDAYHSWRREHPTRPLPRDVEEALVAEVERQLARISDLVHGYTFAREKATAQERTAVVAYLRAESHAAGASPDEKRILTWVSGRIRGGEHRREEVK